MIRWMSQNNNCELQRDVLSYLLQLVHIVSQLVEVVSELRSGRETRFVPPIIHGRIFSLEAVNSARRHLVTA